VNVVVENGRFHLEQILRIKIVILSSIDRLAGKTADCIKGLPERQHRKMRDVGSPALEHEGSRVAGYALVLV
jgi:hypothetical protein